MKSNVLASLAAFSLVVAPVAAEANVRDASPVAAKEDMAGFGSVGLLLGIAILAGIVAIVADGSDSNGGIPTSP